MLLFLFSLLVAENSVNFKVGFKYNYVYNSSYTLSGSKSGGSVRATNQNTVISAMVSVYCKSFTDGVYNLQMVMNQVHIVKKDVKGNVLVDEISDALQQRFAGYFIFSLSPNGKISDVFSAADEDSDVLEIKSGIASRFQFTSETADLQGLYRSEYDQTESDGTLTLSRTFSEKDFAAFYHPQVTSDLIALMSSETKTFQKNLPQSVLTSSDLYFSGEKTAGNEAEISAHIVDSLVMTFYGKGTPHTFNGKLSQVFNFNPDFYVSREKSGKPFPGRNAKSLVKVADDDCPSNLDLCKNYTKTITEGDKNFGVNSTFSAFVGINDECPTKNRNFDATVETSFNFSVLGFDLGGLDVLVQYGYVRKQPLKNEILIVAFNETVYQWQIPDVLCNESSASIPPFTVASPSYNYTYVIGGIIKLTFEIGMNLTIGATLVWDFCDDNSSAKISAIPDIVADTYAEVSDSIVIASGGVILDVNGSETANSTIGVNGKKCVLDIKMFLDSDYTASFDGWIQLAGGDKKEFNIFNTTIYDKNVKIVDYEFPFGQLLRK